MRFDHERLDVYRVAIDFASWSYRLAKGLKGPDRHARDQLFRSSTSIPLNIAEGNGRIPGRDRQRFLQIAYGSALESAATLDLLAACGVIKPEQRKHGRELLLRIVSMLIRLKVNLDQVRKKPCKP